MCDQSAGMCWPEQEVVRQFLKDADITMGQHDINELCNDVSRYRLEIQGKLEALRTEHQETKRQHQEILEIEQGHTERYMRELGTARREISTFTALAAMSSVASLNKIWLIKRVECDSKTADPIAAVVVTTVSFATTAEEAAHLVHHLEQSVELYEGWLTLAATGNCMFPQFIAEEVDRG